MKERGRTSQTAFAAPSSSARLSFLVVVCAAFVAMFLPAAWRWPLAVPILLAEAHLLEGVAEATNAAHALRQARPPKTPLLNLLAAAADADADARRTSGITNAR